MVTCADGATYTGEILIGADGVHSKVRNFLFDQLAAKSPELEEIVKEDRTGMVVLSKFTSNFILSRNDFQLLLHLRNRSSPRRIAGWARASNLRQAQINLFVDRQE